MDNYHVCILSEDNVYARKMAEFFMDNSEIRIMPVWITDFCELEKAQENYEIDCLIIDSCMEQNHAQAKAEEGVSCRLLSDADKEAAQAVGAGEKYICIRLSEIMCGVSRISKNEWRVSRYISCRSLLKLIEEALNNTSGTGANENRKSGFDVRTAGLCPDTGNGKGEKGIVIGVLSAIGRCGKTSFSVCAGKMLGKKGRSVLVTMDICNPWFEDESRNLAGLIYDLGSKEIGGRDKNGSWYGDFQPLEEKMTNPQELNQRLIDKYVKQKEGISYIPAAVPDDRYEISGLQIKGVLEFLKEFFDYVIVDYGCGNPAFLTEECRMLFVPEIPDLISREKAANFRNQLKKTTGCPVYSLTLPVLPEAESMESLYSEIIWSGFGQAVEDALKESGLYAG